MNPDTPMIRTEELIFGRLQQDFSQWVLLAPVAFAFIVVFLVIFYRQQETLTGLLKSLFIPPVALTVLSIAWAVWLLVYVVAGFWLGMSVGGNSPMADFKHTFLIWGLVPLVVYPALLGVLATCVICARRPAAFIPLVMVAGVSTIYLLFAWVFKPQFSWMVVLVPVLLVALVYVGMMYRQDAQTVHPAWAAFLGLLRCTVYGILGFIFLMPGCQAYDTKVTESKVLVLFDISGSMNRSDRLPEPGKEMTDEELAKMPKRLDDVIDTFVKSGVLQKVQQVSPVTLFRFGARLDDFDVRQVTGSKDWNEEQWRDYLKEFLYPDLAKVEDIYTNKILRDAGISFASGENPLAKLPDSVKAKLPAAVWEKFGNRVTDNDNVLPKDEWEKVQLKLGTLYDGITRATNVSGSALQALLQEAGSNLQAIVIVSDGQSNLSSADSMQELLARAGNPKKSTSIITVCVGNYTQPRSIFVSDIHAPETARPDDKFVVEVPVQAEGLDDKKFEVRLEAQQVIKVGDRWEPKGVSKILPGSGTFKAQGGKQALDKVKFEIDVRKLGGAANSKDDSKDNQIMGYWQFTARVPRDPEEHFPKDHVSRPARVLVQKKKMRVLLFAGSPSNEYQFLRTLLFREMTENRMELTVYLQSGKEDDVEQDVPTERLLNAFPATLAKAMPKGQELKDLASYDVIIALDPDWTELTSQQLQNINDWVTKTWAGGFVFEAGPINSYQLSRGKGALEGKDISAIKELLPVQLKDTRLVGFGLDLDPTRPYLLNIKPAADNSKFDFMRLTEDAKTPAESWKEFFWEDQKPGGNRPVNGFYSYYPVEQVRAGGQVLASFDRPAGNPLVPDLNLKEPPFIAERDAGKGKCVYLGGPEFCRLRQVDEEFHKRFWVQLIRYAGSGTQNLINENGVINTGERAPVGIISFEAQLMKATKEPFPAETPFQVHVTRLADEDNKQPTELKPFELKPRPDGTWTGWFQGEFQVLKEGRYRIAIPIPGTNKEVERTVTVYRPDPETDNPRPNPDHMYELSTGAQPILKQVDKKYVDELREVLQKNRDKRVSDEKKQQLASEGKDDLRLAFDLSDAPMIPNCLVKVPPSEESLKGGMTYLMDRGLKTGLALRLDHMVMAIAGVVGAVILLILLITRRWPFAAVVAGLTALVVLGALGFGLVNPNLETFAIDFSFVLVTIAALLCVEWLTRKLLRLA